MSTDLNVRGNGFHLRQVLPTAVLVASLALVVGCNGNEPTATPTPNGLAFSPAGTVDPKVFTEAQYERVRSGLVSINVGQMLIERTHPTGTFLASQPPTMVHSADRREIIAKVTGRWAGGVSRAVYETSFTIEITKSRTRLTVERDTAVLQIAPEQLRLAEFDVINIVQRLL